MKDNLRHFPYIRSEERSPMVVLDTAIALIPPFFMAYFYYGIRSLAVGAAAVGTAVLSNWFSSLCNRRGIEWWDASPVVTGMIIALLMPASVPLYVPTVAALFAIIIAKLPYGGTGHNIFNPAAAGLVFVTLCFGDKLNSYPVPLEALPLKPDETTKLVQGMASILKIDAIPTISTEQLALGNFAGPMGTTNILVIAACLIYLLVRKNVKWYVPTIYLATVSVFAWNFHHEKISSWESIVLELVAGSLMFVAVYMLTEPVTLPKRTVARIMYAMTAGILTMLFRYYGVVLNSAVFALLLTNALSQLFDQIAEGTKILAERGNSDED